MDGEMAGQHNLGSAWQTREAPCITQTSGAYRSSRLDTDHVHVCSPLGAPGASLSSDLHSREFDVHACGPTCEPSRAPQSGLIRPPLGRGETHSAYMASSIRHTDRVASPGTWRAKLAIPARLSARLGRSMHLDLCYPGAATPSVGTRYSIDRGPGRRSHRNEPGLCLMWPPGGSTLSAEESQRTPGQARGC